MENPTDAYIAGNVEFSNPLELKGGLEILDLKLTKGTFTMAQSHRH